MDIERRLNYCELSDRQLQSAIRFAEERIRWIEQDHAVVLASYRAEIHAMRRHLINRVFARMATQGDRLSEAQCRDLNRSFEIRTVSTYDRAALIRAITKGRCERLEALTEIEAMALLLRFERHL